MGNVLYWDKISAELVLGRHTKAYEAFILIYHSYMGNPSPIMASIGRDIPRDMISVEFVDVNHSLLNACLLSWLMTSICQAHSPLNLCNSAWVAFKLRLYQGTRSWPNLFMGDVGHCLIAPSHCQNPWWHFISEVLRHSIERKFTASVHAAILCDEFENHTFDICATSPRG